MSDFTIAEHLPDGCTRTTTYRQVPQYDSAGNVTSYANVPVSVCLDCPAKPYVAPTAAQTLTDPRLGWNTAAASADVHTGDCVATFGVPAGVAGVVCGLTAELVSTDPKQIEHGVFVFQSGGRELWCLVERGVKVTDPVVRAPATDTFRIERRGAEVRYFFNRRQIRVSPLPAAGVRRVVTCLYRAGDSIGSNALARAWTEHVLPQAGEAGLTEAVTWGYGNSSNQRTVLQAGDTYFVLGTGTAHTYLARTQDFVHWAVETLPNDPADGTLIDWNYLAWSGDTLCLLSSGAKAAFALGYSLLRHADGTFGALTAMPTAGYAWVPWQSLAFGNGYFVAAANINQGHLARLPAAGGAWQVATRPDGINVPASGVTVAFDGARFVTDLAASDGHVLASTTGARWDFVPYVVGGADPHAYNIGNLYGIPGGVVGALYAPVVATDGGATWITYANDASIEDALPADVHTGSYTTTASSPAARLHLHGSLYRSDDFARYYLRLFENALGAAPDAALPSIAPLEGLADTAFNTLVLGYFGTAPFVLANGALYRLGITRGFWTHLIGCEER